ncbi:anti-sigma factor family protein [Corynebacterium nuruki]|uniref:anti-sigma factor family protein n=1 Tax=Corynebacterium nuruki TaxID=1032851 RepID=UPI0002E7EB24|nr:anti-sigma factor [Corynebacterium nuruki]
MDGVPRTAGTHTENEESTVAEKFRLTAVGHLTPEVTAALVDGELSRGAENRAKVHLVSCPECRAEVREQRQAAQRLRGAAETALGGIHAPGGLRARLAGIPETCADGGGDSPDPGDSDRVGVDGRRRPESVVARVGGAVRRTLRRSPRYHGRR